MAQMTIDNRKRICFLLDCRWTVKQIANDLGRNKSVILREILKRSVPSNIGYGCSNRLCANYDTCDRRVFNGFNDRARRKNGAKCWKNCSDFVEASCEHLQVESHVCNGCSRKAVCPLMKRIYVAEGAQANRESLLHDSRTGIHPSEKLISEMNAILSPGVMRGQSVRHIRAVNPELFKDVSERSLYEYISGGIFDIVRGDLPEACHRRRRKQRKETKTNAKCRVGRCFKNFVEFCIVNDVTEWTELDTVIGKVGGKVLFTMILPGGLMIAFLRERKSSQTCTRIFNELWRIAGPELFVKLFSVILTDNGSEFTEPEMIENFRPDPEHNPTKLLSRGIHLFYCDAYCSSQKPHVEREHREERRILVHGVSFDTLTQEDINLACSHVASYTRPTLDNRTPYDVFIEKFGEAGQQFLDALGIKRIPGNEVTLKPILLGEKFKALTDKAILRKHGVLATKHNRDKK